MPRISDSTRGLALRDRLDILHALDLLDQHLDADLAIEADGALDLAEQGRGKENVGGRRHLGHHDGVEMGAGALHHLDDVAIGVFGGEIVDPHAAGLAGPVEFLQRLDDVLARAFLGARRNRILEIEKDMIGAAGGGLGHHLVARARHRQVERGADGGDVCSALSTSY